MLDWKDTVVYDPCADFSSEPRWYNTSPNKVDAMALFMQGMLGKEEGMKMSMTVSNGYDDNQLTMRETVQKARDKWEPIITELDKLIHMVRVRCSFCSYFHECSRCPIGKGRGEDGGKFCVEYWEISKQLPILRDLARNLLDRVNTAHVITDCQHHREAEITIAGDEARFFQCVGCGRHRKGEYL